MGYSEDLAIEKRPKMRCNWASKSPSYFLPVPKCNMYLSTMNGTTTKSLVSPAWLLTKTAVTHHSH